MPKYDISIIMEDIKKFYLEKCKQLYTLHYKIIFVSKGCNILSGSTKHTFFKMGDPEYYLTFRLG